MKRLWAWWFPEWPAARLALVRIGALLYVLQDLLRIRRAMPGLGRMNPALWEPVGVTTWLDGPLAPDTWLLVYDATILAGVVALLGVAWRVTGPIFAALLLFSWTYRVSWQMIYHVHHLAMLHVLILAVAPAASAWSLDAWLRRRRGRPFLVESPDYAWPLRLMCVVTTLTYMLAGVAKVQLGGWDWADGHNLLDQIGYDGLHKALQAKSADGPSRLIPFAYAHPWVLAPMAAGALILELGAPIALFHRRLGYLFSLGAVGLHWGIHLFMNLVFPYPISGLAFLSFFPMERLIPRRWRG